MPACNCSPMLGTDWQTETNCLKIIIIFFRKNKNTKLITARNGDWISGIIIAGATREAKDYLRWIG